MKSTLKVNTETRCPVVDRTEDISFNIGNLKSHAQPRNFVKVFLEANKSPLIKVHECSASSTLGCHFTNGLQRAIIL